MRTYKSYPIVDATDDVFVKFNETDIRDGIPQDPTNCAIALSIKRNMDAIEVEILPSVAYVVLEIGGKPIARRYIVDRMSNTFIRHFDKEYHKDADGTVRVPRHQLRLKAPMGSTKLGYEPKIETETVPPGGKTEDRGYVKEAPPKIRKTRATFSFRKGTKIQSN